MKFKSRNKENAKSKIKNVINNPPAEIVNDLPARIKEMKAKFDELMMEQLPEQLKFAYLLKFFRYRSAFESFNAETEAIYFLNNRGIGMAINKQVKQDMERETGTSYNRDVIVDDPANNQFISRYVRTIFNFF